MKYIEDIQDLKELMFYKLDKAISHQMKLTNYHTDEMLKEILVTRLGECQEDLTNQINKASHVHQIQEISTLLDTILD